MNTLGKNIRTLRQKQGWSQSDAAKQLNISIPAFSKIETGITDPSLSRLNQIADLFQVSVTKLIYEEKDLPWSVQGYELAKLQEKLTERDAEVVKLQRKIIDLYEEVRGNVCAS